jgi:DNA-directed RNA polymerase specialized sigma24 family protein
VLDIPVGTVKSRLAAALQELRSLLHDTDRKAVTP